MRVVSVDELREYLSFLPELDLEMLTSLPQHSEEVVKRIVLDDRDIIINMSRNKDYIVADISVICHECVIYIKFDVYNQVAYYEEVKYQRR